MSVPDPMVAALGVILDEDVVSGLGLRRTAVVSIALGVTTFTVLMGVGDIGVSPISVVGAADPTRVGEVHIVMFFFACSRLVC